MKHRIIKFSHYPRKKCEGFDPITAAVSLGSDLLGGWINNQYNQSNMKKQFQYNSQLMDKQNAFTLDLWNKANAYNAEYNDPKAIRDRMKNAGLNPILMGDGVQGSPATAAPLSGASGSVGLPSSTSSIQNPQLVQAQIDNIKADTEAKQQSAGLSKEEAKAVSLSNDFNESVLTQKTTTELARLSKELMENKVNTELNTIYYNQLQHGDLRDKVAEAYYKQFESLVQSANNLVLEGKKLSAEEKELNAKALNYAATILLGYAGLQNNIKVAEIQAAATRYAADRGFSAQEVSADKTATGFGIRILKALGLDPDEIEKTIKSLNNNHPFVDN